MEKLVVYYYLDGMHVLVFIRITCCESTTCQFFSSMTIHYDIYKVTHFWWSGDCIVKSEVKVVNALLPYITKSKYT